MLPPKKKTASATSATFSPLPPPRFHRSSLDLENHYSQTVEHRAPAPPVSGISHWQHQQHSALANQQDAAPEAPDPLLNPLLEFEAIAANIPASPRLATGYHRISPTTSEQLQQDLQRLCSPLLQPLHVLQPQQTPQPQPPQHVPTTTAVSATPEL